MHLMSIKLVCYAIIGFLHLRKDFRDAVKQTLPEV